MRKMERCIVNCPARCRGTTLTELLVALALGACLLAVCLQLFLSTRATATLSHDITEAADSGRFALRIISGDARRAGFLGLYLRDYADIESNQTTTSECPLSRFLTQQLNNAITGYHYATTRARDVSLQPCLRLKMFSGGDLVTLSYGLITNSATANPLQYFALTARDQLRVTRGNNVASAQLPTSLPLEAISNTYYVGVATDDSNTSACPNDPKPTLRRIGLTRSGTLRDDELVRGIEKLQLLYGVDDNDDEDVDRYVDSAAVSDWTRVYALRIWLSARAECADPSYHDTHTYSFGARTYHPDDHFRRQIFSTTIRLMGRKGKLAS